MIQLWIMHTAQGKKYLPQLLSALTEEEKTAALRYRFEADRVRSALGAWMIHKAFAEDYPAEAYKITHNAYGKPYYPPRLLAKKSAYFNLSHSGELVVLAKAPFEIGVDVEQIRPLDFSRFRSVFTEQEMQQLQRSDMPQEAFFALWTKKEAFVKCIGKGISALDAFADKGNAYAYSVHRCDGHIITVCSETAADAVCIKALHPDVDFL